MKPRMGLGTMISLLAMFIPATAQPPYGRPTPPRKPAAGTAHSTGQPQHRATQPQRPPASPEALMPREPQLYRRVPDRGAAAPFVLTPAEQAELDRVLQRWEQHGSSVKTFECKFTRFDWDPVWRPDQPMHVVQGEIRYAAPDKGMLRVDGEIVDFQWHSGQAIGGRFVKGQQAEHWISNGKSIFEYNFQKKQLIEHKLPPELWGKAISDSPLPFLFGAKAEQLKKRYFLRIAPESSKDLVWLEAHPKFQADAANFQKATMILTVHTMQPFALELVLPNGKSRTVYQFEKPKVNVTNLLDPLGVFENNWLHPRLHPGWTRVVEEAPEAQATRAPTLDRRR